VEDLVVFIFDIDNSTIPDDGEEVPRQSRDEAILGRDELDRGRTLWVATHFKESTVRSQCDGVRPMSGHDDAAAVPVDKNAPNLREECRDELRVQVRVRLVEKQQLRQNSVLRGGVDPSDQYEDGFLARGERLDADSRLSSRVTELEKEARADSGWWYEPIAKVHPGK
jgi:hypothetical protein